jgi:hypothetical protein
LGQKLLFWHFCAEKSYLEKSFRSVSAAEPWTPLVLIIAHITEGHKEVTECAPEEGGGKPIPRQRRGRGDFMASSSSLSSSSSSFPLLFLLPLGLYLLVLGEITHPYHVLRRGDSSERLFVRSIAQRQKWHLDSCFFSQKFAQYLLLLDLVGMIKKIFTFSQIVRQ